MLVTTPASSIKTVFPVSRDGRGLKIGVPDLWVLGIHDVWLGV